MLPVMTIVAFGFIVFQLCLPFLLYRLFSFGPRIDRIESSLEALNRRLDTLTVPDATNAGVDAAGTVSPDQPPPQSMPKVDSGEAPSPPNPDEPSRDESDPNDTDPGETGLPEGEASGSSQPPPTTDMQTVPAAPQSAVGASNESLEERLGTKWAVYLGGLAVALGGIFLVRHAIEAGLLGPTTRVVLGALLGSALVIAGMRMRSREVDFAIGVIGGAHVPSVLTAAGTVVLFASTYAAHALYGLIGPATAFILLGVIGLGTLAAALLQGPALAGLGLVGAYGTPLLVTSTAPSPWPVVIYLTVVSLAALALARLRAWQWLAYAALAGVAIWAVLIIGKSGSTELWRLPAMVYVLVQTAITIVILAVAPHANYRDKDARIDPVASIAIGAMSAIAVLALLLVPHSHWFHTPFAYLMVVLIGWAGITVMPVAAALLCAGAIVGAELIVWPTAELLPSSSSFFDGLKHLIRYPDGLWSFLSFAAITSLGLALTGALSLWRRPSLPAPIAGLVALGAALAPLLALALAYLRVTEFGTAISFTLAASVLALGFATVAEFFNRRTNENNNVAFNITTGVFAAAAISAIAIGLVAGLQRGYLTAAFAIAAAGTAYIADRKQIPLLRYAVAALSLVVLARVIWDPLIMGANVGTTPILNWLLVGYGVPAACFAMASHYLRRQRADSVSDLSDALAILFTALLGVFQIRHAMNGGEPLAATTSHVELGLQAILMLALSYALALLISRRKSEILEVAQAIASAIGAAIILIGLGLVYNPMFSQEIVGGSVPFSTLMLAYLAPGLMALYIARHTRGLRPDYYLLGAACLALALIFTYVTLETRHAFHGANINARLGFFSSEILAYNVIWLLLAIAFLAYGLVRGSLPARAVSGVLLVATTIKVGLFDLAGITGIWRALSFLCLGGVLIAIGMIYQRLVFQSRRTTAEARE